MLVKTGKFVKTRSFKVLAAFFVLAAVGVLAVGASGVLQAPSSAADDAASPADQTGKKQVPVVLTPHEYFSLCLYKRLLKPDARACWGPVTDADCLRCVRAAERLRAHGAREFFYAPAGAAPRRRCLPAPCRLAGGDRPARPRAATPRAPRARAG